MAGKPTYEELEQKVKQLEEKVNSYGFLEKALKESKKTCRYLYEKYQEIQVYQSIIDSSADAMVIFDLDGKVVDINQTFTQVFGWTLGEIEGKRIPFLPESEKQITTNIFTELIRRGIPCHGYETKRYNKDRQLLDVSLSASRYHDHEGKPAGILFILRDISKIRRLQKQLLESRKIETIGTLAGGIAHDFNNILFSIIGYAEMIKEDIPENTQAEKNLNEVLIASARGTDLIKHILTFSRQREPERKPLMVQPIIREVLKLLMASIPANIKIKSNINGKYGPILADATQIHQVIMNLSTNAYNALKDGGGTLDVSIAETHIDSDDLSPNLDVKPGPYLKITVSDTGHGIDKKVIERIFDPFFTTRLPGSGSGMGLSIVYGIIKNHDGDITVSSEPGKGTTFYVYLPRLETSIETHEPASIEPILKTREHILLVDDDEQVIQMEQQMLERLGYNVTARTSSMDALGAFGAQPEKFDLVITDMTMLNMAGTELAQELMSIRPDIPIILCTGFSEQVNEEKAKALGIREYVMKPVVKTEIEKVIRRMLTKKTKSDSENYRIMDRILIIDDEDHVRKLIQERLKRSGYEVADAPNGKEAVKILESTAIDLVLTDIRMPEMDGFEVLTYINVHFPSIPVIAMSGFNTPETIKRLKKIGTLNVIDKPVNMDQLIQNIEDSLKRASSDGSIMGMSVIGILQLIEMEQKSCLLEVSGEDQKTGSFFFNNGVLYDAFCGNRKGEEAALEMMAWGNARFIFKNSPETEMKREIKKKLMSLALESSRLKDEMTKKGKRPDAGIFY